MPWRVWPIRPLCTSEEAQAAYEAGRDAAIRGQSSMRNPHGVLPKHPSLLNEWDFWRLGWEEHDRGIRRRDLALAVVFAGEESLP